MEDQDIIKRTALAREAAALTQIEIAKKLGVDRATYSNYEISRPLPARRWEKFCEITGVSQKWLTKGEGSMFAPDDLFDIEAIKKIYQQNAELIRENLELREKLSEKFIGRNEALEQAKKRARKLKK